MTINISYKEKTTIITKRTGDVIHSIRIVKKNSNKNEKN